MSCIHGGGSLDWCTIVHFRRPLLSPQKAKFHYFIHKLALVFAFSRLRFSVGCLFIRAHAWIDCPSGCDNFSLCFALFLAGACCKAGWMVDISPSTTNARRCKRNFSLSLSVQSVLFSWDRCSIILWQRITLRLFELTIQQGCRN